MPPPLTPRVACHRAPSAAQGHALTLALALAAALAAALGGALAGSGCAAGGPGSPASVGPRPEDARSLGPRTQTSGCHARGLLPDVACTPGSVRAGAAVAQICTPGYARAVRDVPEALKWAIYGEYGVGSHVPGSYEVDHLVPLELGGANSPANLWPEAAPGYHQKDVIENELHDAVCAGRVGLAEAQHQIARDWRHTAVGPPPGASQSQ